MKTIILWLMITPGQWEVHNLEFKDHIECTKAENVLRAATNKKFIHYSRIKEIFKYGGGTGMFFIGCHR